MSRAVLLIAHGSRLDQANREAIEMASRIESKAGCRVHACFLEIAAPTIEEAFRGAIEKGASEIVAVPFLLSAGTHVTRDIPRILEEVESKIGEGRVEVSITDALGPDPMLDALVVKRIESA